jgi:two-component system KDP operon response regulator KdpE
MDSNHRILIVEDDNAISGFLSLALTDEGYEVSVADNGLIGLSLVESFCPDLILLDMRLPLMDGQDFLAVYKGSPDPAPIIGISAVRNAKGLAESLGVADFLEKPFSLDDLFDRMKALLG